MLSTPGIFPTTPPARGVRVPPMNCWPLTAGHGRIPIHNPVRKILIKNNLDEISEAAAGLFVAMAIESIATRGKFSVALAGGSTQSV